MNDLQVFSYEGKEVRTIQRDGETWWVAKDVCDVFGETNRNRAMQALEEDEKGYTQMSTPGGTQQVAVVNEPGLYALLFAMQPTKARGVSDEYITDRERKLKNFKRWVTHEVLPSIRRHGAYITSDKLEEIMNDPDAWIKVLTALKEERQAKERLQLQAVEDRPKVVFADAVSVSDGTILIGELAKILKGNGVEIGQNRLFERLRQDGFLIKRKGTDYNAPTQKAMELGLFKVKETAITHSDGHVTISKTTKVTGKGQQYFVNYFLSGGSGNGQV
ncbi:phage antirepressor Ant [Paradesulfitobacterium aromaticivorans]